jgi:hypothetical protein
MNVTVDVKRADPPVQRRRAIRDVFKEFGDLVLTRAEELVPVDTGDLYRSLRVEVHADGFTIYAGEGLPDDRARFQEEGFHHVLTGQFIVNPYIRPAIEQYREQIIANLAGAAITGDPRSV